MPIVPGSQTVYQRNPISEDNAARYDEIRYGEKRGFYCIDWEGEDISLGISKGGHVSYFDIMLAPCNFIGKPEYGLNVPHQCISDLKA